MMTLSEILKPRHVALALGAADAKSALEALTGLLQGDPRISNWLSFQSVLQRGATHRLTVLSCGAALCHARTDAVAGMVMAAARLVTPMVDPERSDRHFRLIFAIGLPPTMASEYLRVVGALARALADAGTLDRLGAAETPNEFVTILSQREMKV